MRILLGTAALTAAGTLVLGGATVPAQAAKPASLPAALPASLAKFANCPVGNPAVSLCLYSATTSTSFKIGSTTVASKKPAVVSLGIIFTKSGRAEVVLPDNGTKGLVSPAIPLPGGLTGIPGLGGGVLSVTATPELVGTPSISLKALLTGKGTGLTLPIDILVSTPTGLLGSDCTIGGPSAPVTLALTTGKTSPPPPAKPMTGAPGKASSSSNGVVTISGMKLVDNAFAVGGAENCGLAGILDPVLNLDKGLPSPAGENAASLAGSSYTAPASLIRQYVG